ncbi:choline O-acetyltransferase-like [Ixodes scapularis]|uniref:choline O-acetyltransferase-like n=1 Tax=Ixodes scapularis TaxID=6945 RepID=UPI001A9E9FDA|nr:choline O-acetyltransferase-like [Ixodes scapularis]
MGSAPHTDVFVYAHFRGQEGREHCIPRCVLNVNENNETRLPIMNVSDHNLDIEENERIARAVVSYPDDEPSPRKELSINTAERRPVPSEEIETGPSATLEQREVLERLIDEYSDCFARNTSETGHTEAEEKLKNSRNAACLEAIQKAALVVCLDGGLADLDPYEVAWPRQVYKGGPNAEYAANRWWDKPVQVIVGEDGGSALLYDHAAFDGTAMAGVTNHCYDYAQKAGSFEASEDGAEAAPHKLEFVIWPDTLHDIEKAKSFHARYAGGTERLFYRFSDYSKTFVQSCNMSPDGYAQMAMQLAASR